MSTTLENSNALSLQAGAAITILRRERHHAQKQFNLPQNQ
jgi:hypothetical protein